MIQKAIRILKVVSWVSIVLGILLVFPLLVTVMLAVKENYWPPLIGVTVAFLVFFGGGIKGLMHAKKPGLNATQVLSLVGSFVAGVFGCAIAALAVVFVLEGIYYDDPTDVLLSIFVPAVAILYIFATVLYSKKLFLQGSTLMIIAGVLNLPVGILALIVALQIRKVAIEIASVALESGRESEVISTLPETIYCPDCGKELELEDKEREEKKFTCPECNNLIDMNNSTGEVVQSASELTMEYCIHCGTKVNPDYNFCINCGKALQNIEGDT